MDLAFGEGTVADAWRSIDPACFTHDINADEGRTMTMSAQVRQLIDTMTTLFPPPQPGETGADVRARTKRASERIPATAPLAVGEVSDRVLPGPLGEIPVRVYQPHGTPTGPLVVFFHGGGWTVCDLDSHDGVCRALCKAAGCTVVAVDYRLAPEHKFPVPVEDCYAALDWLATHAETLGADPSLVVVAGDSAGGNLAAAVSMMARDRGGPVIRQQLLIYPVLDHSDQTPSHQQVDDGYFLTSGEVMFFWDQYLTDEAAGAHPCASPLRAASLAELPPALIITAEFDPLRDEGEAYGMRLREFGTEVTIHRYEGMFHSFWNFGGVLPEADQLNEELGAAVRGLAGLEAPAIPADDSVS